MIEKMQRPRGAAFFCSGKPYHPRHAGSGLHWRDEL